MAERRPSFPFYPKDWLASASVSSMPLAAQGLYVRLMAYAWQADGLPCSHEALRNLVGVSRSEWRKLWPSVAPLWREENGRLFNLKLERVRAESAAFSEAARAAGRASAAAKAQRKANESGNGRPTEVVTHRATEQPTESQLASAVATASTDRSTEVGTHAQSVDRARAERPVTTVVGFDPQHGAMPSRRFQPGNAWQSTIGKPVKQALHVEFADSLANAGDMNADATLCAWYADTEQRYRGKADGRDAFKFWRDEFAAWQGGGASSAQAKQARQVSATEQAIALTRQRLGVQA